MALKSKPANGTATGKNMKNIRKGSGQSFKTETPTKSLAKKNITG